MAKATAEFGATLLMYCVRNVDYYREELVSFRTGFTILHLHGCPESIVGRDVAMIGFGRIGRALVDLARLRSQVARVRCATFAVEGISGTIREPRP
jgi:lactate dehydrogenase-like 2-hydroxyacid dehydrogenase